MGLLRLTALAIACSWAEPGISAAATASGEAQQRIAFSIPAQPLSSGIVAFSRAAGVDLAFDGAIPENVRTRGVSGAFTVRAALARLLSGTGFAADITSSGTVRLTRVTAQAVGGAPAGAIPLDAINVQGSGDGTTGYVATQATTATKTTTPLIQTPQSISVVTRKQMDDQDVQSVPQALRYSSGVVPETLGVSENAQEYIYGRGFLIDSYLDGLRLPTGNTGSTGYNVPSFDPYFLQSIQVLHGPASVLYGQASPGGIVDLESKLPPTEPLHEISFQTGSYGRLQGDVDVGGPVDASGHLLYRITAVGLDTGTQVDGVRNERIGIAPAITWRPDGDTSLTVLAKYQYDPDVGYYNFLPVQGTVIPTAIGRIPLSFNPGDPNYDHHSRTTATIGYKFEHKVNDILTLRQNFRFLTVNDSFLNVYGFLPSTTDPAVLNRYAFVNNENLNYLSVDNQAQVDISTGPLQHTMLFGIDYTYTFGTESYGLGAAPPINILAPNYGVSIAVPAYTGIDKVAQNRLGLYAQDQIAYNRLHLLIGVRADWYNATDNDPLTATFQSQTNKPITWRTGAVYEFASGIAPYVSYSTSFQPDDVSIAANGVLLQPTTAQQYEGGVKYQPPGSQSFVTAAVYDLTEQNVATQDPNNPAYSIDTGEIRSRGVELEGHANLTENIDLVASYTYDDAKVTKSNTDNLGMVPAGVPQNMASVWGTYRFNAGALNGLQLGAGVRYVGQTWADPIDTYQVPAYTLVDAGVQYDFGGLSPKLKNWHASVNATNLFNKIYVAGCTYDTNCNYGLGRTVLAKLTYRW